MLDMTTLYCAYVTETWEVRPPYPEDPWDNGDSSGDYYITNVYLTGGMRDAYESNEDIKAGDDVYVVYVAYDSGSTFGTEGGYGEIIAITKDPALALKAVEWTEQQVKSYRPKSETNVEWPAALKYKGYLSCTGYFEHNQRVRVERFMVQP